MGCQSDVTKRKQHEGGQNKFQQRFKKRKKVMKIQEAKKVYLEKKRYVKKIIAKAKNEESKKLITELVEKEGLHYIYKMVKYNGMEKKEIMGIPCLMGKDGQIKAKLTDKLKEFEEYASNILNVENKWDGYLINLHVEGPCERFFEDVWKALNSMKTVRQQDPVTLHQIC